MEQPMQSLTPEKILALWEIARPQHPLDRALTILAAASPGVARDTLAELSIAERDARLLHLRTLLVGSRAEGFAECPRCAERLEFSFDTADFVAPTEVSKSAQEVALQGRCVGFRLPSSRDLAETVAAPDAREALRRLVERCLLPNDKVWPNESDLPDELVESLSRAMLAADPRAEIVLDLNCPACAHRWNLLFDVAEFFWTEIGAQARRLLREIDALARAYGWTEREILDLPPQRRQTYLELIAA
jgi:hypothetical protein